MNAEKESAKRIEMYKDLAKEKGSDAAALMIAAMEQERQAEIDRKKKRWAYLISVGLPPFGLYYAFRYYFNGKAGGKRVALICVILTVGSLLASYLIFELFVATAGDQLQQMQTLNSEEYRDLLAP